jgi:hypothetical protein
MGAAAIPFAIMGMGIPLAMAGIGAVSAAAAKTMEKAMKDEGKDEGGGATQIPEMPAMPAPAPQKDAADQYNRMRERQRRDRMRRGLASTIRTGGMGDTTLANLSAPSLLGGTQKTLLGQ